MNITRHAIQRMSERQVTAKQLRFAIRHGEQVPAARNATAYCFDRFTHYRGTERIPHGVRGVQVVVANGSGKVLTCIRKHF